MDLKVIVAAVALAVSAGSAQAQSGCVAPPNINAMVNQIASGLNATRSNNGLAVLNYNPQLSQAAMNHGCDMQVNSYFGHHGSNGSDMQDRARSAGYRACLIAENLAWGYPDPNQILSGWMSSQKHRENMLVNRAADFGVGVVQGSQGPIWILLVARAC